MARWDEILTLPVQNPPTIEFSSSDIVWSRVEGWRDAIDRVALIPFSRVDDFVRGESSKKDCPTRFHVEARRRRPPEMAYKPKVDGILEYILYWCSFGPDDHRKGGVVRPSRVYNLKKNKTSGRPNTKRGCVCHFIVKRLIAEPTVALIIYNQDKHVDKKGLPCHGPLDTKAVGTCAMFAPYISDEARLRVLSLLYVGVPVETIMQRHNESVEKQGGPSNRDDLLTHRYVRRLERSIRRSTYELDPDDAVSVSMWVESHRSHIFFYEDFSDSEPFVIGIQTEWQLQQMIRLGNRSLVASDSRFGTNKLKYPVYSLLVFDSNNKAIPVAWIITPHFASGDTDRWIRALYDRVHSKDPTWKLAGFIVDDPSADIIATREVFQCSVLICFWRVRHAWHKNLIARCSDSKTRVEISRRFGKAIYSICKENANLDSFEDFMEDFIDCSDFLDYFKATWFPRMGMWTTALKSLPLAGQAVCSAIESYHHQFKLRLLNEKDPSVYQRVDWLVDKLGTKVHSYYWLDEYSGKDDFARYQKDEWKSGLTSWQQALQIPDSNVIVEHRCAKVISQFNRESEHIVWNPGSEFAICECNWSKMGNLCKHVIKVSQFYRDRSLATPSISLFKFNQILNNMLHCPPHDSLIRDHAVSLSICAQMQLNAIFNLENRTAPSVSVPLEEPMVSEEVKDISEGGNKDSINGNQCMTSNDALNDSELGVQDVGCAPTADDMGDGRCSADTNVAGETAVVNMMDVDLPPKGASQSMLVEQQPEDRGPLNDGMLDNTDKILMKEKPCTIVNTSSNGNGSKVWDMIPDEITENVLSHKAVGVVASVGGICCTVTEETVTGNMMNADDMLPGRTSPLSLIPVQQPMVNGCSSAKDISEKGALDDNNMPLNKVNFKIRYGPQDETAVKGCFDKVVERLGSENGACGDVSLEAPTGNVMDIDERSTLNSGSADQQTVVVATNSSACGNTAEENSAAVKMDELGSMTECVVKQAIVNVADVPCDNAAEENSAAKIVDIDPQESSAAKIVDIDPQESSAAKIVDIDPQESSAAKVVDINPQSIWNSPPVIGHVKSINNGCGDVPNQTIVTKKVDADLQSVQLSLERPGLDKQQGTANLVTGDVGVKSEEIRISNLTDVKMQSIGASSSNPSIDSITVDGDPDEREKTQQTTKNLSQNGDNHATIDNIADPADADKALDSTSIYGICGVVANEISGKAMGVAAISNGACDDASENDSSQLLSRSSACNDSAS